MPKRRLTFDQLFRISDPKRVTRSADVNGPPLDIDSYQDTVYYCFNFKSHVTNTTGLRHRGFVKFYKPRGNRPVPLQHLDCLVDCTCFGPETPVLMANGAYKPISQIRDGDFVYTHKGRVRRVLGNVARQPKPGEKVYRVKMAGFPVPMIATEGHPFYAFRGNTVCHCGCGQPLDVARSRLDYGTLRPAMLMERQYVKGHAQPVRTPNSVIETVQTCSAAGMTQSEIGQHVQLSHNTVQKIVSGKLGVRQRPSDCTNFEWIKVGNFRQREWILSPWLEEGRGGSLSSKTARFLGYYAADGCLTRRNDVSFSFHTEEEGTLGADVIDIVESPEVGSDLFRIPQQWRGVTGNAWRITRMDQPHHKRPQKCFQLLCHVQPEFKRFIAEHIGCGSWNKRLSAWFMSLDNATLKEFVVGLFLGDGTFNQLGHFRWSSVSEQLVWNTSTILRRLRIDHVVTKTDGLAIDINRGDSARTVHDWLKPYLREEMAARRCTRTDDGSYTQQDGSLKVVRERQEVAYHGEVWDLCVEEDHSFIAAGVAVANCPDYRYRWAWTNKQRGSGQVGPQSLNQAWNKAPRRTNPKGVPGLCKHILAARGYIYGILSSFPSSAPDTSEKFDKLLRYATKRWSDFSGAMAAARQRERMMRSRQRLRNVAGPLDLHTEKPAPEIPPALPAGLAGPEGELPIEPETETPGVPEPPELPTQYELPARPAQPQTASPAGALPTPTTPIQREKTRGKIETGGFPTVAQMRAARYGESTSVVITNSGKAMSNELREALQLVEEIRDDISATQGPDEFEGGAGDDTIGNADMAPDLPPSEPPISDSALGADTEGDTALGLLTQMRDALQQLATALAPPPADDMALGAEGAEGAEMPGGAGAPAGDAAFGGEAEGELGVPEPEFGAEGDEGEEGGIPAEDEAPSEEGGEDDTEDEDTEDDEAEAEEGPGRRPTK